MEKLFIIKIGGNVIDKEPDLHAFLDAFSRVAGKKILVHGGGKIATHIGDKLGVVSKYVDGRRITDNDTLDLVTMVYGGLINKKIVAYLQSQNCNAIGLSGADANVLPAKKRPVKTLDYGWVGDLDVSDISVHILRMLIAENIVPVMAPLTHDRKGHILNTNADTIAAVMAIALANSFETKLIYCFEKDGVMADVENNDSVLDNLDSRRFALLKAEHKLFAGILPKLENSFMAIENKVAEVVIGHSEKLASLIDGSAGTRICL